MKKKNTTLKKFIKNQIHDGRYAFTRGRTRFEICVRKTFFKFKIGPFVLAF